MMNLDVYIKVLQERLLPKFKRDTASIKITMFFRSVGILSTRPARPKIGREKGESFLENWSPNSPDLAKPYRESMEYIKK